mmetsp:Transcript_53062/g.126244  ORF Transcript_53062/g.126244 Transcript_53062/m.126244 type:complete len:132 (-) Transcript_53062:121-516(-)
MAALPLSSAVLWDGLRRAAFSAQRSATFPAPPVAARAAATVAVGAVTLAVAAHAGSTLMVGQATDLQQSILWGRHDRRTLKGKRKIGTYGKIRPRKEAPSPWSLKGNDLVISWLPNGCGKPAKNPTAIVDP